MRADRLKALRLRADLYMLIRAFFAARGVLEVETPMLSAAGNTDPNIESFVTGFSGHVDAGARRRWLRTSPEFPLKRLLAEGVGDCYELGRVFRNGEAGRTHNPEFTMLEWYRVGIDHHALADEVLELVGVAMRAVGRTLETRTTTYRDWFRDALSLDPFHASVGELRQALGDVRIDEDGLGRDDWLDLLITHRLQPALPADLALIVHDFPASQCALARVVRRDDVDVAERFECYLGGRELANGYHELNDAEEQSRRFLADLARRQARGQADIAIDQRLIAALPGLPDCAGVALGIERLLQTMLGTGDLRDVLAYAFDVA
ncbi:MAG: EF-P lysine aminoacylase GenX [Rhodanobacteraceae bacterium]|nr:EF-P lysine aminoacylase GenX [Rhodanobacteraceae bacterium]MBL0041508.1 EF-P lysine aminoacylase GenX [Xanthomonadales bacterium]MBP6078170.1 EF-P lysine aminoacylase GenX [Xanthomonadales bacterium]MBP7623732.1 EF-P lysine aminoacylase GenX [Xanthomonadales bacterium]